MKRLLILLTLVLLLTGCTDTTPTPTDSPPPTPTTEPSELPTPTPEPSGLPTPTQRPSGLPTPTPAPSKADGRDVIVEMPQTQQEETRMDAVLQWLLDFCTNAGLPIVVGLCALDLGFGVGAALRTKSFDWKRIGDFYVSQILALLIPYVVTLGVLAIVPGLTDWLPVAVAPAGLLAGIMGKLGGSIISNAQKLGQGAA